MPECELNWIKATSSVANSACIELARDGDLIALRNSRSTHDIHRYTRAELAAFLDGAKRGEFDHLIDAESA